MELYKIRKISESFVCFEQTRGDGDDDDDGGGECFSWYEVDAGH